jgi:hypothetical protein
MAYFLGDFFFTGIAEMFGVLVLAVDQLMNLVV